MSCRVCHSCNLSLPNKSEWNPCPVCGHETEYKQIGSPDKDWEIAVEVGKAKHVSPAKRRILMWRRRSFVSLGYGGALLDVLVESPVDPHALDDLIKKGAERLVAAQILL